MRTVLSQIQPSEIAKADFQAGVVRITPNEYETALAVAARLGNTTAVCRKCYIHPAVLDSYMDGEIIKPSPRRSSAASRLSPQEAAVVALIARRLKRSKSRAA